MNNINLIGRLTKEPTLEYTRVQQTPVTKITIAVDKRLTKQQKQEYEASGRQTANFIRVVIYGSAAENLNKFVGKGNRIGITGRIDQYLYTNSDGNRYNIVEVIAEHVTFIDYKNDNQSGTKDYSPQDNPQQQRYQQAKNPTNKERIESDDFELRYDDYIPF